MHGEWDQDRNEDMGLMMNEDMGHMMMVVNRLSSIIQKSKTS